MFITYCSETEQQCHKCSYRGRGLAECNVDLCKGGWQGYFTMETTRDVEKHQDYFDPQFSTGIMEDPTYAELVETPLDIQVGGKHYKDMAIQPVEFCQKNQLNHCESSIVKYACRHKIKNGIEDVRKIIHYAQLILQLEYGVNE